MSIVPSVVWIPNAQYDTGLGGGWAPPRVASANSTGNPPAVFLGAGSGNPFPQGICAGSVVSFACDGKQVVAEVTSKPTFYDAGVAGTWWFVTYDGPLLPYGGVESTSFCVPADLKFHEPFAPADGGDGSGGGSGAQDGGILATITEDPRLVGIAGGVTLVALLLLTI